MVGELLAGEAVGELVCYPGRRARPGTRLPLLLFGGLAALLLPLSVLFSPRLPTG